MQKIDIAIHSFRQVQDFVNLAMTQPFEILVGNEQQTVNATAFMGMLSLDYSRPVQVVAHCSEEEFAQFRQSIAQILV